MDYENFENSIAFHVETIGGWKSERAAGIKKRSASFQYFEEYSKKTGAGSIIKSGKSNDHPRFLKDLLGFSALHKTLVETKATLAMGDSIMFQMEDDADPQEVTEFMDNMGLIDMREGLSMDIATFGGFCVQMIYENDITRTDNGIRKLKKSYKHDFDEFRLMKPVKDKYGIYKPEYGCLHPHWGNRYKAKDTVTLPLWHAELDKDGELTEEAEDFQLDADMLGVDESELPEYQDRFFYYDRTYTNQAKFYPVPDYQTSASIDAIVLDGELIHFDVREIENGMSIDYIFTIFRKNWSNDDPEKEKRLREAERNMVSQKMTGSNNKGKVILMRAEPDPEGNNKGNVDIQPVPNNNNADRHNVMEKRKNIYILVAHGIIAPEIGGVPDLTKGGFSSEADKIVDAIANLFFTRLNKWRAIMSKFYIRIAREHGYKVKNVKFVDKIPFRKKIEEGLLKYAYTINEIREMNGAEPLTEENREQLLKDRIPIEGVQTSMEF